jgi:hypothetical protein
MRDCRWRSARLRAAGMTPCGSRSGATVQIVPRVRRWQRHEPRLNLIDPQRLAILELQPAVNLVHENAEGGGLNV